MKYGDAQKERGLMELALASGNARVAAKALAADKEHGFRVSRSTLERWKTTERDRYMELHQDVLKRVRAHAAVESMKAATATRELNVELVEELRKKYPTMEARYLGNAIQQTAITYGVHIDKAEKLTDQAVQVVHHRSADEVLRKLQSRGAVIELEAEEIEMPDALPRGK